LLISWACEVTGSNFENAQFIVDGFGSKNFITIRFSDIIPYEGCVEDVSSVWAFWWWRFGIKD
jgi:hypothetical protein